MGNILYSPVKLSVGTLYPAYCSFKAVKTKNIKVQLDKDISNQMTRIYSKEYVHWMTYWIVFSLITMCEEVTDLVFSPWFPLYYELKMLFLLWLVSPSTRGSVIIYTKIVHPLLVSKEEMIDRMMDSVKEQSYALGLR